MHFIDNGNLRNVTLKCVSHTWGESSGTSTSHNASYMEPAGLERTVGPELRGSFSRSVLQRIRKMADGHYKMQKKNFPMFCFPPCDIIACIADCFITGEQKYSNLSDRLRIPLSAKGSKLKLPAEAS